MPGIIVKYERRFTFHILRLTYAIQCRFLKMLVKTPTSAVAVAGVFPPQLHKH